MTLDPFPTIKRLVMSRHTYFTFKAETEMKAADLLQEEVFESIWGAPGITETKLSKNPKTGKREELYVIHGLTLDGVGVYTKGKIEQRGKELYFYVLISSKRLR